MENDIFNALNRFKGLIHQMLTALAQHLNLDIVRNQFFLYQRPEKIILQLGSRWETDFDFLKTEFQKQVKIFQFFFHDHRVDQRLITIPKVYTAPDRRLLDLFFRPCTFRKIHYGYTFISLII